MHFGIQYWWSHQEKIVMYLWLIVEKKGIRIVRCKFGHFNAYNKCKLGRGKWRKILEREIEEILMKNGNRNEKGNKIQK